MTVPVRKTQLNQTSFVFFGNCLHAMVFQRVHLPDSGFIRLHQCRQINRNPGEPNSGGVMSTAVPYVTAAELPKTPLVLNGLSSRFMRDNRVVPLEIKNNILKVLMANPSDAWVIDALRMAADTEIDVVAGDPDMIDDYITRFYNPDSQDMNTIIDTIDTPDSAAEADEDIGHLKGLASEAPIIRLVNLIISRAVESRASDIHLEPFADELKIRYRIDGVLHDIDSAPKKLQAALISRIKIMAKLDIAERRLPQDGRIRLKIGAKEIDLRVSNVPVLHGESVVMRILDREDIVIDLHRLGFPEQTLFSFQRLISIPNGIILVTGPTGSGKTTTLYGALDKINSPDKKIITVEDPIEYQLKGINQIQIKPVIGLNFANTLRAIVRHDPDIIMIGEIRDLETAEIAIQSALTGHLVFATLHTNDAASAVTRLLDLGVENFLLSSTIRGILAQRLVRIICTSCRIADETIPNYELGRYRMNSDIPRFKGTGCENCAFTGYYGRTGIYELLEINDEIRKLILKNTDSSTLENAARRQGMKSLFESGVEKIAAGITTLSEVLRVTQEA